MNFNRFLTHEERLEAWRNGGLRKLAEIRDDPVFIKQALDFNANFGRALMAALYGSLLLGLPLGYARHKFHKDVSENRAEEDELKEEAKLYSNALQELNLPLDTI